MCYNLFEPFILFSLLLTEVFFFANISHLKIIK